MFDVKYLPLVQIDLSEIILYIADDLSAPSAARALLADFDDSIKRLRQFPYSCKVYQPIATLENEYRILMVKNYLVFYVVKENEIEIHRIIYAKMDLPKIIK